MVFSFACLSFHRSYFLSRNLQQQNSFVSHPSCLFLASVEIERETKAILANNEKTTKNMRIKKILQLPVTFRAAPPHGRRVGVYAGGTTQRGTLFVR